MSLFKTRTFWRTNFEEDDRFDQACLITGRLNSDSDYIIAGSHTGVLRIFKPSSDITDNNTIADYRVTDLVIERILQSPILQVGCGRLVSGSPRTHLAVLHPRLLSIYSLIIKQGAADHGTQNILQVHYEHKLRRSAANLVIGPFGGSQNRDFLCVQSLDGLLTFYEQESFAFCCFMPDFLLPGPMVFARKSDSFVTCDCNWTVSSFKYKLLSEVGLNSLEDDATGKKFTSDWSLSIGEAVIDLEVIDDPVLTTNCIMVLGERSLFCLSDTGRIKYMKKLDYMSICFANYTLNDRIIALVVTESGTLMIYQDTSLKWSAKLDILPVAIRRAVLTNIMGVVVLLSEEGHLECCYLGSEPSLFVAPPLTGQDLDFEKAGQELAKLNKMIKKSYMSDIKVTNASAERELTVNIAPSPHLEDCTFPANIKPPLSNQMCTITVDLLPQALFEEVQVSIFVQKPLKAVPAVEFFNNLSERASIKCRIFMEEAADIPSLTVRVTVSFISNLGVPRTVTKSAMLPANLVLETCPPRKDGQHKVTLTINQSPVGLSSLFPEFAGENSVTSASNAIGLRNCTGAVESEEKVATVLLAKSSERYRLQSDSFSALSLVIELMIYRLRKYFSNKGDFCVAFASALPVNETVAYINRHFELRQKYNALQNDLTQLSVQFRLIQKRLIWKFKVKNPTPLSNLELLLQDTFTEIIKTADKLERERQNLQLSQIELSCALSVIVNLADIMDINDHLKSMVASTFSPHVVDLDGQNWEDVTDASLCYLLRTILAKSDKDKLRAAHTSFDEIKDIAKLEKHLSQVLERIPKVAVATATYFDEPGDEPDRTDNIPPVPPPIGSQLGESSLRALSARKSLLRKRHKIDA